MLTKARHDTRDWLVKRRGRTRHLIELSRLVVKSGLVELTDDDRAAILGALTEAVAQARSGDVRATVAIVATSRPTRINRSGTDFQHCMTILIGNKHRFATVTKH